MYAQTGQSKKGKSRSATMSQEAFFSNEIALQRELKETQRALKQKEMECQRSMQTIDSLEGQLEREKCLSETIETVLTEKNEILQRILADYKDRCGALMAKKSIFTTG